MKKLHQFTCLMLIILSSKISAQTISGYIKNQSGDGVEFISVLLLSAKDSAMVKGAITDIDGKYEIKNMVAGRYLLAASGIGYDKTFSQVFDYQKDNFTVAPILLKDAVSQLKGVTVTATKPLVEVQADKLVVNVEGSINSTGLNALEVLQKSPGIQVDQDDNVVVEGKQGVRIYIDGKPSPLSGRDLAAVLKGMQSSDIEAIEIITNPSAKYDAAGNVGIINIRLKKNKKMGTNGNITLNPVMGVTPKINLSGGLNYRNNKWNLFGTTSYGQGIYHNSRNNYRRLDNTAFNTAIRSEYHEAYRNIKIGTDYTLNDKNTIGMAVNGSFGSPKVFTFSQTNIGRSSESILDSAQLVSNSSTPNSRQNLNYNFNYRFADTTGHELTADIDFGNFIGRSNLYQPNIYSFKDPRKASYNRDYRQITPTDITIFSFKIDYEQPFYKGKLGYGLKASAVKSLNTLDAYNLYGAESEIDTNKSNSFTYSEKVMAGYINYNKTLNKKWSLQAGLRGEHTLSDGNLVSYKENALNRVDRSYFNLFPSFAITYNVAKNQSWNLNYSKRINRPGYQDLNPFEYKQDELTYYKGNAFLKPRYTDKIKVSNTLWSKLTTSLSYSYTTNEYNNISRIDGNKIYNTTENFSNSKALVLDISLNTPLTKWWELNYNLWFHSGSIFGKFTGENDYNVSNKNFGFNGSTNFKINKSTTFEISGYYRSQFNWIYVNKAQGMMDLGLKKKVLKDKADLKLSVSDIFNTVGFTALFDHNNVYQFISGVWEARRYGISFNYRFGSSEIKSAREHKSGAEEESGRIR